MNASILKGSLTFVMAAGGICISATAAGQHFSGWLPAEAVDEVNVPAPVNDGCPIESPDGLSLYIASNRPGTFGANDIWVADRTSKDSPWGEPQSLGAPVNTEANDFCPTPLNGNWLLFVSERPGEETCDAGPGRGDMYLIRQNPAHGWGEPLHLGCAETGDGPNTAGAEFSPSLVETPEGTFLFYSSDGGGNMDLYVSVRGADGHFAPGSRIDELSTGFDDRMPNVSKDGLEIVFSSNRTDHPDAQGGQDVYTSSRSSVDQPWSPPVNVGGGVNTGGNETRASMSWDRTRLHFGRDGDVYVSKRDKLTGRR